MPQVDVEILKEDFEVDVVALKLAVVVKREEIASLNNTYNQARLNLEVELENLLDKWQQKSQSVSGLGEWLKKREGKQEGKTE